MIDEPVFVPRGNRSIQLHKSTLTQQAKLGSDLLIGNLSEPISEGAKLRNFGLFGFCNRVQLLKFAYIIHQCAHQNAHKIHQYALVWSCEVGQHHEVHIIHQYAMHTRIHQNAHTIH